MDFLLECIGFPPDVDPDELISQVLLRGEGAPWRGDREEHMRLPLGAGLELRLDREPGEEFWTLLPYHREDQRLRFAVDRIERVPDSPFDALLEGWAAPPAPDLPDPLPGDGGAYRLSTWIVDARRLPARLPLGHVLAISTSGFALNVDYVGPNAGVKQAGILELPHGASIEPLGGADSPAGCCELSVRVRELRHLRNPLSGREVAQVVIDSPGRPLSLFLSPWQLQQDGLPMPRPGWRIEGVFLFSGRIAGGLTGPRRATRRSFG